jgi:signal transduction histidine kinase
MPTPSSSPVEWVLILAPVGRDGALAAEALRHAGIASNVCTGIDQLCENLSGGAGTVLLTEEALSASAARRLLETLERQPPWSDVPLVVFTRGGEATAASLRTLELLGPYANVSLLERPVRAITLVAAIRVALRARRRQHETRDYLAARERVEADLRVANAAAERAGQAKDRFLAMLGHELRSPLAAILNGIEVLDRVGAQRQDANRVRAIIGRQARHLTRLVDDLLDVSRITSGKIVLQRVPLDLRDIARQSAESIRAAGTTRSHDVSVLTDDRPVVVEGDPVRLAQIVGNLLDNAVTYSPEGGPISVLVRQEEGQAVLRVQDRGVGLEPEMLQTIFKPFTQIETSLRRPRGGLGLGLAVARGLVDQHGGSITAHSPGLGQGCEFVVRFPLSTVTLGPPTDRPVASTTPRRIVVIEDYADASESLRMLLTLEGHRVEVAGNGRAGLDLIVETQPDAALIDIGLPELDGYEVAQHVRRSTGGKAMRLIALTGYGEPYDRARAHEAGFDRHLTKPVDAHDLRTALSP